ncbi:Serine protease gd [Pseudolycoriella hygida]|uniref:Serine protease gd n=1 Tax=Pseudolycoriella hygida TaxID=35572 RepID=A0A9Q0N576_9DIPT|nr:Serine protease gd [Pseudolycoriella hygida]
MTLKTNSSQEEPTPTSDVNIFCCYYFSSDDVKDVTVLLGVYNLDVKIESGAEQRDVDQIFVHPDWKPFNEKYDADLTILVLSDIVDFTNYIRPICMPDDDLPVGARGTIVGWGLSENSKVEERQAVPIEAPTSILNDTYCYTTQRFLALFASSRTFCGGGEGGSPNKGDSGGGLFVLSNSTWIQYGIISASLSDARGAVLPDSFSIYTSVREFAKWIHETVANSGSGAMTKNQNEKVEVVIWCNYEIIFGAIYKCSAWSLDVTEEHSQVDLFTGDHLTGYSAQNVSEIWFWTGRLRYIPSGIGRKFPNLEEISIGYQDRNMGLRKLKRENFEDMEKLRLYKNAENVQPAQQPPNLRWLISKVEIKNFKGVERTAIVNSIKNGNGLPGYYETAKENVISAIMFGLGANLDKMGCEEASELKHHEDESAHVTLTLRFDSPDNARTETLKREITYEEAEMERFFSNDERVDHTQYMTILKEKGFELDKQFFCCDPSDFKFFYNASPQVRYDFLSKISDLSELVRLYDAFTEHRKLLLNQLDILNEKNRLKVLYNEEISNALPDTEEEWDEYYTAYVTSCLMNTESKRIGTKRQLAALNNELTAATANMQRLEDETPRNLEQMLEIPESEFRHYNEAIEQRQYSLRREEFAETLNANEDLINLIEEHRNIKHQRIDSLRNTTGTRKLGDVLGDDAWLKLENVFNCRHEKEEDEAEFQLSGMRMRRHRIDRERYFDELEFIVENMCDVDSFLQRLTVIKNESKKILHRFIHPNLYVSNNRELKFELLKSSVPADKGFVLRSAVQTVNAERETLIKNILYEHEFTVVLYHNNVRSVHNALQKVHHYWFKHVDFVVLSDLKYDPDRSYIVPFDHWLTHCEYEFRGIEKSSERIFLQYLGNLLHIRCVERLDEVREEFELRSNRFVASQDGQLIYHQNSMGIRVLVRFQGGKKISNELYRENCKDQVEQLQNLRDLLKDVTKSKYVPVDIPLTAEAVTQEETELNGRILDLKAQRTLRMTTLRQAVANISVMVPGIDVTLNEKDEEYRNILDRLAHLNQQKQLLTASSANNLQAMDDAENRLQNRITREKLELKGERDRRITREYLEEREQLSTKIIDLKIEIGKNAMRLNDLKYESLNTIVRANKERINWADVPCTPVPGNLLGNPENWNFIDPNEISFVFPDMEIIFDVTGICFGKREWYQVIFGKLFHFLEYVFFLNISEASRFGIITDTKLSSSNESISALYHYKIIFSLEKYCPNGKYSDGVASVSGMNGSCNFPILNLIK